MESLTERFDAVQENLLELYESGSDNIEDQILYWNLMRKEGVLFYYARQKGITRLGLQHVPSLAVSEFKAKQAIMMTLQLESLKNSEYGSEKWTMQDTSLELYNTEPQHTFKKGGQTVNVYYDNNEQNYYPYTLWKYIYYQTDNDQWHKAQSDVDYEGIYYESADNVKHYYVTFDKDAARYSDSGVWTVKYNNRNISSTSITSTGGKSNSSSYPTIGEGSNTLAAQTGETSQEGRRGGSRRTSSSTPRGKRRKTQISESSDAASVSETDGEGTPPQLRRRLRRGGEQRKQTTDRRRGRRGEPSYPTPEEVGSRHRRPEGTYHSRLRQLQEDARDPPVLIVRGSANTLKCWKNRCRQKHQSLFLMLSTVFSWVAKGPERIGHHRMLVAFTNSRQRQEFLTHVKIPKGTSFAFGNLFGL